MSELISALILLCGYQAFDGVILDVSKCTNFYNCKSSKKPFYTSQKGKEDYRYEQVIINCNKQRTTTKF